MHNSGRDPELPATDKPTWVDALEETLLLGIGLFALITWIFVVAVVSH